MDLKPYATARPFMGPLPTWLSGEDQQRIEAYSVYESIYKNVPEAFKLVQRGNETNPIYIPSARTVIEATNRYLAKRWTYSTDPLAGTDADRAALRTIMNKLFRREQIWSKFNTQKRYGLIRGDQVWQIVADENKPLGSRVSIYEVDPSAYFPIADDYNPEKVIGCHLVEPVVNSAGKTVIKRQTYRKNQGTRRISYELSWWEVGAWDDRDGGELKPSQEIPDGDYNKPTTHELDPLITSIPVYHIKNNRSPNAPFGESELAGFETLIAGINQAISDEDLALALEGLGLYWTNSGPPVDDEGNETNWKLGPGWVVEVDSESEFGRVPGVGGELPALKHIGKLEQAMREASGVPDIAIGAVDTNVAESGIALAFKMAPILAKNEEKEADILAVTDHMLYDIVTMWFPVYEDFQSEATVVSIVDDPMPINREAVVKEVQALLSTDPPLISAEYARQILSEKLGYEFTDEMGEAVVTEAAALAAARNVDPFASRVERELETGA